MTIAIVKKLKTYTPRKGVTTRNKIVTPSLLSKKESKPSTSKVALSLVAFTLASNAASHSSLRPKRSSHHAPNNISTHPLIIPSVSGNKFTSKKKHASTIYLLKILTTPSIESYTEISASREGNYFEESIYCEN